LQYRASDAAIRTAQWALRAAKATGRNKCLRYWMDNQGVGKQELYALCKHLAQEFEFAQKLNSQARQASAERAWVAISTFYRRCRAGEKQKGYPQFQKNGRFVEYKQSGWKLSADGMAIACGLRPADASGKVVIAVPPEYTTQECSGCGHLVKKTLSTRTHQCPFAIAGRRLWCGWVLCRDQNAALLASAGRSPHILRRALKMLGMEWNSTVGHTGTASKEGTLGEMSTAALEGQADRVSAVVEPGTRIPCL